MPASYLCLSNALGARLAILAAVAGGTGVLHVFGYSLLLAATVSCVTAAGAVEVGCRLTMPVPALGTRVSVVVIVLVFVVSLIWLRYPWLVAVALVLGVAVPATEIARRLTGVSYRLPRLTF